MAQRLPRPLPRRGPLRSRSTTSRRSSSRRCTRRRAAPPPRLRASTETPNAGYEAAHTRGDTRSRRWVVGPGSDQAGVGLDGTGPRIQQQGRIGAEALSVPGPRRMMNGCADVTGDELARVGAERRAPVEHVVQLFGSATTRPASGSDGGATETRCRITGRGFSVGASSTTASSSASSTRSSIGNRSRSPGRR